MISAGLLASAQITVTSSDLPAAGLSFVFVTDDTSTFAIPSGGMSQTWNFSTLGNLYEDTTSFINAAGTPHTALFPTANLAAYNPYDSNYTYFTSNTSGFYVNGNTDTTGTGSMPIFNPALLVLPTPFTYNDTRNYSSRLELNFIDNSTGTPIPIKFVEVTVSDFLCDGFGSLTTPAGSYTNTLRIKISETAYDSIYADIGLGYMLVGDDSLKSTSYRWVGPGPAAYLMSMETDSAATSIVSTQYLSAFTVGINGTVASKNQIKAYPNPAIDHVRFEFDNNTNDPLKLEVMNELGQSIYNESLRAVSKHNLNVSTLPNGVYYFNITTNGRQESGKFIVSH